MESASIKSASIESARIEGARIESARIESARMESARIESARMPETLSTAIIKHEARNSKMETGWHIKRNMQFLVLLP